MLDALPPLRRLALAYAPARAREATLALLALDTRLAGIVRNSREPSLAQLRLAWWREQLQVEVGNWPRGEPLLVALESWQGRHGALIALVDGWEYLTGAAPLPEADLLEFARGRGEAFAALAEVLGVPADGEAARQLGRRWALADLAGRVAHPQEQASARRLLSEERPAGRVSRPLRPLTVLHGLALRDRNSRSFGTLLTAMRLGLAGR